MLHVNRVERDVYGAVAGVHCFHDCSLLLVNLAKDLFGLTEMRNDAVGQG
jgi:hypothetical protein